MISENARKYENVVIRNEQEIGINNFGLDYMVGLEDEIERLNNIIKEVRKHINKRLNINSDYVDYDYGTELLRQELLEILDKENK